MDDYYQEIPQIPQSVWIATLIIMAVLYFGATAGLSFIPASMAKKKGYSFAGFYCLSFFAWFLGAIIIAALITDKNPKPQPLYVPYYASPYPPYGSYPPPYGYGAYPPPNVPPYNGVPTSAVPGGSAPTGAAYFPPRCPNCGETLTGGNDFCVRCGARLG
jgi:hypothetical protein